MTFKIFEPYIRGGPTLSLRANHTLGINDSLLSKINKNARFCVFYIDKDNMLVKIEFFENKTSNSFKLIKSLKTGNDVSFKSMCSYLGIAKIRKCIHLKYQIEENNIIFSLNHLPREIKNEI